MDTKYYICKYCHEQFTPARRYVQKYCSDNCRSKAHHIKKRNIVSQSPIKQPSEKTNKIDSMSLPGIGNATAGSLAADGIKALFTTPDDRPATKGDLKALGNRTERYHKVVNLPPSADGTFPYFDMETNQIVYLYSALRSRLDKQNI